MKTLFEKAKEFVNGGYCSDKHYDLPLIEVDGMDTLIESIHGDYARGYLVNSDCTLSPCYIARFNGYFSHGDTLKDAFNYVRIKALNETPVEERVKTFIEKFPSRDIIVKNLELFEWHHYLTDSCKLGREKFVKKNNINLDGEMTIREFIELTKNSYGGETIEYLERKYEDIESVLEWNLK